MCIRDSTYVEPDVSVICDPSKLNDKGCAGAPDWIIEVVSPGSQRIDYMIKLFKYRTAGVREYWIVDKTKNLSLIHIFSVSSMRVMRIRCAGPDSSISMT